MINLQIRYVQHYYKTKILFLTKLRWTPFRHVTKREPFPKKKKKEEEEEEKRRRKVMYISFIRIGEHVKI